MDATEETGWQVLFKDTGGDSYIGLMKGGGKGMGGKIQTTALKIVAHLFEHQAAKVDLLGGVK